MTGSAAEMAEVREELRAVARDILGKGGPAAEPGWDQLAASGWLGLEVAAELDGADATFAEVAVIAEELGRAVAGGPYLGAIVLGVGALLELGPSAARDELLAQAAIGEAVPVAVVTGDPVFRLMPGPDGHPRLHGRSSFVPDAADASRLLILAGTGADGTHEAGEPALVALGPDTPGLRVTPRPVLDETRRLADVSADGAEVVPESVWRFAGDPRAAVRRLADRAAVALACDSLGVAEAMLDAAVSHAKVRHQFGRPIGSFQAVKHACADMLVQVTVARALVVAAVTALAGEVLAGEAPQAPDAAAVAASMAKSYACAAAVDVAGKAMQLHGGVGYARESGIHAYLKRAALNRDLFGSPVAHRARLAARYKAGSLLTDHLVDYGAQVSLVSGIKAGERNPSEDGPDGHRPDRGRGAAGRDSARLLQRFRGQHLPEQPGGVRRRL
jgi:alkylation response protein AidB-like acyl-CoA dehydrogenase